MADAYTKVSREQIATYLDTTPTAQSKSYKIVGVGITDYGQDYNPQTTTEKWIIHKNATTTLDSFQIQADAEQTCYFGDPVYDFVNNLRRTAGVGNRVVSHVLDIDMYDATESGGATSYAATEYDCAVVVTSYAKGENPAIGYTIYYNGDPRIGTVTIADGVPTFTETI
jgi:hypothetical protein